jgi:hypothetical protein
VQRRSDRVYGAAGLAQSLGFRTGTDLLEHVTGTSATTVRRRVRVGTLTGPRTTDTGLPLAALLPRVGKAITAGQLGIDAAELIGRELATAAPRADVDMLIAAEHALVLQATGHTGDDTDGDNGDDDQAQPRMPKPADLLRGPARAWRDALDPHGGTHVHDGDRHHQWRTP